MLHILLTSSVSFIITFLAIPIILQVADEKKLYDVPDKRKIHTALVPSLGGVGIFAGFILASLLSISAFTNPEFQYFFAASIVIFFLGLKDDLTVLSATKKFIGQVIAAAILIHLAGIKITGLHGLFGIGYIPEAFSLPLSYLIIIVVINSFNLIDGTDGLAGSLGLMAMLVFGIYFFVNDILAYALLAFAMAGSLVAFLIFNYQHAKIFMGDSGSLLLGLINSILVIKFITVADSADMVYRVESSAAVGFAILMVPLLDTLWVFSIRIFRGKSPFTPDRNHIHHLLLDLKMSHTAVTITCVGVNLMFIAMAFLGASLGTTKIILLLLLTAFCIIGFLFYWKTRIKPALLKSKEETDFKPATKVVALTQETSAVEQN